MRSKKSKNPVMIGLDVGNYSVKCVQMTHVKDKIILDQAKLHPVGSQSTDNLTALVKPFTEMIAASPDHVRVVLSGSALLVRCVQMPVMTPLELKSAIRFEAENHIAFPIDDCILDFQIVNENTEKKTMNVLLVAAKRDYIQERLRMLLDLDIHPEVIDVDTFCLVNAFEALASCPEERVFALLNIGHRVSSLAIIREKLTLFVREIPLGGSGVTKAIADAKGISETDAEQFKMSRVPETREELKTATQKGFEALIEEIKHSVDFFENEAGEPVKTVWLSGGGALAVETASVLTESLGRLVSVWDNLKRLEMAPTVDRKFLEENSSQFNVAFGMAVRV